MRGRDVAGECRDLDYSGALSEAGPLTTSAACGYRLNHYWKLCAICVVLVGCPSDDEGTPSPNPGDDVLVVDATTGPDVDGLDRGVGDTTRDDSESGSDVEFEPDASDLIPEPDVLGDVTNDMSTGDEPALDLGGPSDASDAPVGDDTGSAPGDLSWPEANAYSWNGRWVPSAEAFPLPGLLDDEYFDGHETNSNPTPILPPGSWDWEDSNNDLANYRNFASNLGSFEQLVDDGGHHYGWRFNGNSPGAVDYAGAAAYFEGSTGADYFDLGSLGSIHSFGSGTLGPGPDVLVFDASWSLDFRTGSSLESAPAGVPDDDLVIAGCNVNGDGSFDIETTTIHTGPGSDWVFVRDLSRAAIDLGNGAGGRTDTIDIFDGDDLVVIRGNSHDFRMFGGGGDDVFIWAVDDNIQTTEWLGPNFFGGGGYGDALWDNGNDRLVMAVPTDTTLVTQTPTPAGALLVRSTDGGFIIDAPTEDDLLARYCVECGEAGDGRKTVILEYRSADEAVFTGYFYLTGIEELQVGVGEGASVYRIDAAAGTIAMIEAEPVMPPTVPTWLCE